jgi:hypothetical protein
MWEQSVAYTDNGSQMCTITEDLTIWEHIIVWEQKIFDAQCNLGTITRWEVGTILGTNSTDLLLNPANFHISEK